MCEPLTIAGLMLTAGSMVANNIAQGKIENARNDVLAAETQRQRRFNTEIEQLNTGSQDRYIGFDAQQAQRTDELANMFATDIGDDANAASVMPTSTSSIVNRETDARMSEAQDYVSQQSNALASLRSFGDLLGETSRLQGRDASKIGQIGGFKQNSQGLVPYELDGANKAGDGMKLFGDVLRLGGTVATGAGINGGGSGGFFPGLNGPSLGGAPSAWGL